MQHFNNKKMVKELSSYNFRNKMFKNILLWGIFFIEQIPQNFFIVDVYLIIIIIIIIIIVITCLV